MTWLHRKERSTELACPRCGHSDDVQVEMEISGALGSDDHLNQHGDAEWRWTEQSGCALPEFLNTADVDAFTVNKERANYLAVHDWGDPRVHLGGGPVLIVRAYLAGRTCGFIYGWSAHWMRRPRAWTTSTGRGTD